MLARCLIPWISAAILTAAACDDHPAPRASDPASAASPSHAQAASPTAPSSGIAHGTTSHPLAWEAHAAPGAGASEPTAAPATAPSESNPRGTVRETMNAAGYTYMRLDSAGGSIWVATTEMHVAVGDVVEVIGGNEMPGFHSRTLNRTFEQITFAASVRVLQGTSAAAGSTPSPSAGATTGTTGALPPGHPPIGNGAQPAESQQGALPAGHPPIDNSTQPTESQPQGALPPGHPAI